MKRMYSLDFFKLLFAYTIAFFHFGVTLSPGPTATVQIFFFISGFFLAKKFYARSHAGQASGYNQWNYTLDHVKGLYPQYLLSYVMFLLYETVRAAVLFLQSPSAQQLKDALTIFYDQIPNLLFLQSAYYFHDNMNYPLWQLSALVIAGYFVYGLLCHNERLSRQILFPAAILMTVSLLHQGIATDGTFGFLYMPLLRAFAGLCFGVLVFYFTTTPYWEKLRSRRVPFNLAVLVAVLCVFVYADHANIHYVTAALLILGCYDGGSWLNKLLNRPLFRHFGKLSYAIYANHALICRFTNGWLFPHTDAWGISISRPVRCLIFFLLLTVYSVFTLFLLEAWRARKKKAPAGADM